MPPSRDRSRPWMLVDVSSGLQFRGRGHERLPRFGGVEEIPGQVSDERCRGEHAQHVPASR